MATEHTLFTDYLEQMDIRYTPAYSNQLFHRMPFKSLFGLTKLLETYGIEGEGYRLTDRSGLANIAPPFLAQTADGFVVVTNVIAGVVSYMVQGVEQQMSVKEFNKTWTGVVYVATPDEDAGEPHYRLHEREDFFNSAKKWVLIAGVLFLVGYMVLSRHTYNDPWNMVTLVFDLIGLWLSFMLVQKSLKIVNPTADHVCGILQAGGCDDILELKASKFFGLFGWSEVGFAYFSVSLVTLLLYPEWIGYLALCNICCLPFTCWSIWYQKFRAKRWCTLCVSVQATLWLLFFSYWFGGHLKEMFPLRIEFFILVATYIVVLLGLNAITPYIHKTTSPYNDTDQDS
ncbi:MAG: hypothetical protein J1E63_00775 [Muribaculaceae bacterium]|nr:hypothetical protein [Muribaculaceae bacterium]